MFNCQAVRLTTSVTFTFTLNTSPTFTVEVEGSTATAVEAADILGNEHTEMDKHNNRYAAMRIFSNIPSLPFTCI